MQVDAIGWQVHLQAHLWSPPTDLFETDNSYVVRVEVSGMRQQDFSVQLENDFLTVSGSRSDKSVRRAYHQMEVRFGEFRSVVAIPGAVDVENATAEYDDGFLTVILPKATTNKTNIGQG